MELARLNRQSSPSRFVVYQTSVRTLHKAYARLELRADTQQLEDGYSRVLELSELETANSLEVTNRLLSPEIYSNADDGEWEDNEMVARLRAFSGDLDARWKGAIFSLHPHNPDAARHFCTSAREILSRILDTQAPDSEVFRLFPNCLRTDDGRPTRRAKLNFCLARQGMSEESLQDFVDADLDNILHLFGVFNRGTHGAAGTFDMQQLGGIRKRVQDGILFLTEITSTN
jgi:hypothetical protein